MPGKICLSLHHLAGGGRERSRFAGPGVLGYPPRHLAGDDGALAERIGDTLVGLGWRMWPTARHTLLYVSPDGLCGAGWVLATYPFELGGCLLPGN